MNKLSGYGKFQTSYGEIEMKFCNGAYEIFAGLMGFDTIEEVQAALTPKTKKVKVDGVEQEVPVNSFSQLRALRMFYLAAIKYVALVKGDDVSFNEYQISEIIQEIGEEKIAALMNQGVEDISEKAENSTEDKKKHSQRIRASQ